MYKKEVGASGMVSGTYVCVPSSAFGRPRGRAPRARGAGTSERRRG